MAEITLEHVSVTYHRGNTGGLPLDAQARRGRALSTDRAFAERVIAGRSSSPSTWEPVTALNDLNLVIPDGETLAIVGPSGCGKSTLLKVIAGLEPIDSGRVLYDGRDMAGIKPGERGIGMVFQSYALYPHMKGEGNLGFFFRIHRRPSEEMMERIRITSEIMGIGFEQLLDRSPRTLSGGQQQRVAIGRCIVRDPGLFLFDEPLSNLDAKLRSQTRVEVKRLLRRFSITAAYVTHDQSEAIALGDRIAVMRAGRIEQVGTYQQLCALPINHFVAGFVGLSPMNLIDGYRSSVTGSLTGPLGDIRLPEARQHPFAAGKQLVLGFRGESAHIVHHPGGKSNISEGLVIDGIVQAAASDFARHEQLVHLEAGGLLVGIVVPDDAPVSPGQTVRAHVPASELYLFDAASEARLYPA